MENQNTVEQGSQGQQPPESEKAMLPNSTAILVLGITSIVGVLCTQGMLGIILGIIGIVLSVSPMKQYKENPGLYTENSIKNLKAGRICSIIGVSLGGAFFLVVALVLIFLLAGGILATLPFLEELSPQIIPFLPL